MHTRKQYHYSITNDRHYMYGYNLLKLWSSWETHKIHKNIRWKYLFSCRLHVVMCLAITKLVTLTTVYISVHNSWSFLVKFIFRIYNWLPFCIRNKTTEQIDTWRYIFLSLSKIYTPNLLYLRYKLYFFDNKKKCTIISRGIYFWLWKEKYHGSSAVTKHYDIVLVPNLAMLPLL